jgi:hypothetical protein
VRSIARAILLRIVANATRLEKLVLHEISGVDDPANESPGFALFKSKDKVDADGVETAETPDTGVHKDATTILDRVRKLVNGGKGDDLEMDRSELEGILKEREDALLEGVAAVVKGLLPEAVEKDETVEKTDESADESVEKDATDDGEKDETVEKTDESVEKDATDEKDESVEKDATPPLTAEDMVKAISEALAPHTEVAEALLARITAVEERFAGVARKSLEGQEGGPEADEAPTLTTKSAFDAALQGRKVELR